MNMIKPKKAETCFNLFLPASKTQDPLLDSWTAPNSTQTSNISCLAAYLALLLQITNTVAIAISNTKRANKTRYNKTKNKTPLRYCNGLITHHAGLNISNYSWIFYLGKLLLFPLSICMFYHQLLSNLIHLGNNYLGHFPIQKRIRNKNYFCCCWTFEPSF